MTSEPPSLENHCDNCDCDYPRGNDGMHSAPCGLCNGNHPACKHPG